MVWKQVEEKFDALEKRIERIEKYMFEEDCGETLKDEGRLLQLHYVYALEHFLEHRLGYEICYDGEKRTVEIFQKCDKECTHEA